MSSIATVYDVAAHAAVSIATVSRVLRRPETVRESTRQKVLASIRELGYVPSGSARGLASRRTGVIGIFLPDYDDARDAQAKTKPAGDLVEVVNDVGDRSVPNTAELYFDEVLRGAEMETWRKGLVLMVGVGRTGDPEELIRDLAGRVDGLVILARSLPTDLIDYVSRRTPIVLLASSGRGGHELRRFDHVAVANSEGMYALGQHLIKDLSVDDVAYLDGNPDSPDGAERLLGFRRALNEAGLTLPKNRLLRGRFRRTDGQRVARKLLAGAVLPRALVCANDQMALGALDTFTAAGVQVPEQLIITGFDGIDETRVSTPRLTTVRQPMALLGRAAVDLMAQRLANPERKPVERKMPVQLVLRESSER